MALVPASVAANGADVIVECCANKVRAKQVPLPFYKRPKKRSPNFNLSTQRIDVGTPP